MAEVRAAPARTWPLWGGLFAAAVLLWGRLIVAARPDPAAAPDIAALQSAVFWYGVMPRGAMALVAGAALGLAGLILQRGLRNPLAEPATLGISAGAQLALVTATLYAPGLMEGLRTTVALFGGIAAVALVLAFAWRRRLEPVAVSLAGMMLGLTATAASAALILGHGEYLFSLFLWGGGSLVQQGWDSVAAVGGRLVVGWAAAALLARPLAVLGLGDDQARGLGVALQATRFAALGLAVWLAATVTAEVGVIGFVGLAAPHLARLGGGRRHGGQLVAAPLVGALLLWLADGAVQVLAGGEGERIPTGAATALLGGPLLLWLLPRLRLFEWPAARTPAGPRAGRPAVILFGLAVFLVLAVVVALCIGRGPDGWRLATGESFAALLPWRAPRVAVAAGAGALLATAGAILQRITANPLAGPEILGVGAGSGVGLAAALFLLPAPGPWMQLVAAVGGAAAAILALLLIARRGGLGPQRLLLGGIGLGASGGAVVAAAIATGTPQGYALLRWLSGSTAEAGPAQAGGVLLAAAALLAVLPALRRGLAILPLGEAAASAVGLAAGRWRTALILAAGAATAIASLFAGPLSFIGLIAPHLARRLGLGRPLAHAWGSALLGAGLLALSDWLARVAAFPYQLPLGLFAALAGGGYLVWLLGREHR